VAQIAVWLAAGERPAEIVKLAEERWRIGARYTKAMISEARKVTRQAGMPKGGVARVTGSPVDLAAGAASEAHGEPAFASVGPPPKGDALAQVDWIMQAMILETDAALRKGAKSGMSSLKMLDELRKTARACASLLPPERIYDAEQRLKRHAAGLDEPDNSRELVNASDIEARPDDDDPQGAGGPVDGAIRMPSS
jgi:hypothetical protein